MKKALPLIVVIALAASALLLLLPAKAPATPPNLGGYLTNSVTAASTSVGMIDTVVYSPSNWQFFYGKNIGTGEIDCTWTTTSTASAAVNTGLRFNSAANTTSTETSHMIQDPQLLAKYMHCIANATSTLQTLKY